MLHGINILGFFESKSDRRFDNADIIDYMVVFKNTTMPSFILMLTSANNAAVVKLMHYDRLTKQDTQIKQENAIVVANGDYRIISLNGTTNNDFECGYYYLTVTIGAKTVYSEVFYISDDVSGLIGINIQSSDVTYNKTIELPYSNIVSDFYLKYDNLEIEHDGNEDGVERYFGDIPLFSAISIKRKVEIYGTPQIYRMLAYLRIFKVNGSIIITVKGESKEVYDTNVEIKDYGSSSETVIINFTYKEFDFASSSNEI